MLRIIRRAPAGLAIGITTDSTGAGGRSTIGIPTTIRAWPGYGYPYVIDPGFYDWGDTDSGDSGSSEDDSSGYASPGNGNSGYDASAYDQGGPAPAYPATYPDEGFRPPYQPQAAPAPAAIAAPLPNQPLTVIFKDGRAPVRMQNYMMTATVLTDLDAQHYEQIPLDQVDEGATRQVNSAAGVEL